MARLRIIAAVTTSLCGVGLPAFAQTLDYRGFESMFDEPVTISATGKPERISDTPVTMDVITAEDISRSGARDLPTLLRRLPGVDLYHGSPGTEEVSMGGYIQILGARIQVLLNGRQIYLGAFGSVFWSTIPVELQEIRQIEVIRGPQSALYGFNAVDGVINIITFDPEDDNINQATARIGNDARRDGSVSLTRSLGDDIGIRLTAAGDHAHDEGGTASLFSTVIPENPDRKFVSLTLSADLANNGSVWIEASHSDISQRSVAVGSAQFFNARLQTNAISASYSAETEWGRLGASASLSATGSPEASNGILGNFRLHDHAAVGQLYDLFKFSPTDSVRLALDARVENMNIINFTSGTISSRQIAESAMWEHQFTADLTWVNALRYDQFELGRKSASLPGDLYVDKDYARDVRGYSVNSSLIDRLDEQNTLRLSFARGLALPSLLNFGQLALFQPQYGGNYYYGNPDLNPSAVYEERIGLDHRLNSLDALLRLSLFHEQTMSVIQTENILTPTPPPPSCAPGNPIAAYACIGQRYYMGPGTMANGLEFQLDHKASQGLQWGLNYTLEKLHDHLMEIPGNEVELEHSLPQHKINANIGYGWQSWTADLRLFYASQTESSTVVLSPVPGAIYVPIKNYVTLSPRLSWSPLERLTLELTADNLWPFRDNIAQRTPVTYYLSAGVRF